MEETVEQLNTWRQEVLSAWTDHRIVDDVWVDHQIWFFMHLYADLAKYGAVCTGYSFREKLQGTLMVLKVVKEENPYVVFVNGSTPTGCIRILRRQLREGELRLVPDQYA